MTIRFNDADLRLRDLQDLDNNDICDAHGQVYWRDRKVFCLTKREYDALVALAEYHRDHPDEI